MIKILEENTLRFEENLEKAEWIPGDSCWGLGFLNSQKTLVGCLLHPAQNQERDLRDLTGYGAKCRRELCREAAVFDKLDLETASFIIRLTHGLDAFEYSSPNMNPAFNLLMYGEKIIRRLFDENPAGLDRLSYRDSYADLYEKLNHGRDGYSLEKLLDRLTLSDILDPGFLTKYRQAMTQFVKKTIPVMSAPLENRPYVHQLDIPVSFARFLRSALGIYRAAPSTALKIKNNLDDMLLKM